MSINVTVSNSDIEALEKQLRDSVQLTGGGVQENFCDRWPSAKAALQVLQSVLDLVPGVGFFAKPAIIVVIAAGDAAHRALCKQ